MEQSPDVADDVKLESAKNYRAALNNLQSAADSENRHQALVGETEAVSQHAVQLQQQQATFRDKTPKLDEALTLMEMEQLLPTTELQLSAFKKARQDARI